MAVPMLVSCEWLNEKISNGSLGNIVIVDVSWASIKDCRQEYDKQHIPGARYIDVLSADHNDIFPRNIPTAEAFTQMAQEAGINSDSHIIVYSNSDRAGYFIAGRGWWSFHYFGHKNVSILDGGLQKWIQLGFPTTDKPTEIQRGNFVASVNRAIHKNYQEIKENTSNKMFQLIDSRPESAYKDSHIPGAKHLFMSDLVDEKNGTLKSKEELKKLFTDAGVDLSKPVAAQCNSGMSSCTIAFTAEYLGAKDVSVFHGGFTEWKKRQEQGQ